MKKLLLGVSCVAVTFLSIAAIGEDAVTADPKHYKVEFENDKVRIIRIKYGPGEKSVMHTHGPNAAIFLSSSKTRMTLPDGTSQAVSYTHLTPPAKSRVLHQVSPLASH